MLDINAGLLKFSGVLQISDSSALICCGTYGAPLELNKGPSSEWLSAGGQWGIVPISQKCLLHSTSILFTPKIANLHFLLHLFLNNIFCIKKEFHWNAVIVWFLFLLHHILLVKDECVKWVLKRDFFSSYHLITSHICMHIFILQT